MRLLRVIRNIKGLVASPLPAVERIMHKRVVLLGICVAVALAAVARDGFSPAVGAGGGTISEPDTIRDVAEKE